MKIKLLKDGQAREIELEEYLRNVVPAEMPNFWPQEALKAQAVASRSFALYALDHPRHEEAHLCSGPHCQIWVEGFFTAATDEAIKATKDEFLTYDGKVIEAVYSADCGGRTSSAEEVWGNPRPYLVSVDCSVEGTRLGHGVGMCQRGALELAKQGKSYEEILKHFYKGVELWKPSRPRPRTRYGLHGIRPNQVVPFLRQALENDTSFGVIKMVDDITPLKEVKELDPNVVTVGRFTGRDSVPLENPVEAAHDQMRWLLEK